MKSSNPLPNLITQEEIELLSDVYHFMSEWAIDCHQTPGMRAYYERMAEFKPVNPLPLSDSTCSFSYKPGTNKADQTLLDGVMEMSYNLDACQKNSWDRDSYSSYYLQGHHKVGDGAVTSIIRAILLCSNIAQNMYAESGLGYVKVTDDNGAEFTAYLTINEDPFFPDDSLLGFSVKQFRTLVEATRTWVTEHWDEMQLCSSPEKTEKNIKEKTTSYLALLLCSWETSFNRLHVPDLTGDPKTDCDKELMLSCPETPAVLLERVGVNPEPWLVLERTDA